MDDFDPYDLQRQEGNFPLPEPPQAPPPPQVEPPGVPEDFTSAQGLRLDSLQQSWSQLQQEHESGLIDADTFGKMAAQIQPQRVRLLAQKQASEGFKKQQAIKDAHETAAVQKSIQLQDSLADADTLPNTVRPITNPANGRTLLMAPKGYQVIDDGDTGDPGSEGVNAQPPDVKPNPDGTHTMTIQNGSHRTEVHFAQDPTSPTGWRTQAVQNYDEQGRPIQPGAPVAPPAQTDVWNQARQMVGPEPPRFIAGPHGRPVPNPAWGHWDTAVRQQHTQLWKDQRSQQQEESRRQHEERQKVLKEKTGDFGKWVGEYENQMQKSADKLDNPGKDQSPVPIADRPEHLQDDQRMHAEAVRKAVRKFVSVHGHPPEGYNADGSPKGGSAPNPTEAHASVEKKPALPQIPAGAADLPALLAEKKRREQMKQPPPAVDPTAPVFQSGGF